MKKHRQGGVRQENFAKSLGKIEDIVDWGSWMEALRSQSVDYVTFVNPMIGVDGAVIRMGLGVVFGQDFLSLGDFWGDVGEKAGDFGVP
jgi:hypothetical protein